jgi:hypothetical protein
MWNTLEIPLIGHRTSDVGFHNVESFKLFSACRKRTWMSENHYVVHWMFKRGIGSVGVEKYIMSLKDYPFEVLTGKIDISEQLSLNVA